MFNAIPATTALGITNPMSQQTALAGVSQAIRTNNQEQLEPRSVGGAKESRQPRHLRDRQDGEYGETDGQRQNSFSKSATLEGLFREKQQQVAETTQAVSAFLLHVAARSAPVEKRSDLGVPSVGAPTSGTNRRAIDIVA